MKKVCLLVILLLSTINFTFVDEYATTDSGKTVLIKDDGTWKYVKEEFESTELLTIEAWKWENVDYADWISIYGYVKNNSNYTLHWARIIITAKGENGNYLGNGDSYFDPFTVGPGETANFNVLIRDATCRTNSLSISYKFDWE